MNLVAILYIINQNSLIDSISLQFSDGTNWPNFGSRCMWLQLNPFFFPKCCFTPGLVWKRFSICAKDWRMDRLVWLLIWVLRKVLLQHHHHHRILRKRSWISRKWKIRQPKIWIDFFLFYLLNVQWYWNVLQWNNSSFILPKIACSS